MSRSTPTRSTHRRRTGQVVAVSVIAIGLPVGLAAVAYAHNPDATGKCDAKAAISSLSVHADSYDARGTNTAATAIDGAPAVTDTFGTDYNRTFSGLDSTKQHTYVVQFTAHDDPDGNPADGFGPNKWTRRVTGTIEACTTPPPPPPTTPPVTPPTTPPVTPPPAPPTIHVNGMVKTFCNGAGLGKVKASGGTVKVPFVFTAAKRTFAKAYTVTVTPNGKVKTFRFKGQRFAPGTKLTVKYQGKVLDTATVPPKCETPVKPPNTGLRKAVPFRIAGARLVVPTIGVNAVVVRVGKTGGSQAVGKSVRDVFPLA